MSDLYTATDEDVLEALKTTHVVAIYGRQETRPLYPIGFKTKNGGDLLFMCILWDEKEEPCIGSNVLINTYRWVAEALRDDNLGQEGLSGRTHHNNVLIHSLTGCHRAPMVALAMLAPSMGEKMLHTSHQKLLTARPSVSLSKAMNVGLDAFWVSHARNEEAGTTMGDNPSLTLEDIFSARFPVQDQGVIPSPGTPGQKHEWWNVPTSWVISRDGPLAYSAVLETPRANRVRRGEVEEPNDGGEQGENGTEEDDDGSTVIADARDTGNALLGDLERGDTLEAIDVGSEVRVVSENVDPAYSPYPSFNYPPNGYGTFERRI